MTRQRTIAAIYRDIAAQSDSLCTAEYQYGHLARTIVTPAIKRRADAEWAAMDSQGRLPEGWAYSGENNHG